MITPAVGKTDAPTGPKTLLAQCGPWCGAVLSGLLLTFCYPRFDQEWLCWIALTPLIAAVWFARGPRKWWRDAALGYVTGIVFFTGTFSWLSSLGTLFASFWLHGLPFLLSFYLGIYFAFWSWFIGWFRGGDFSKSGRNLTIGFVGAAAWVAQEWVRGWLFSGFGWNGLGIALHADLAMIQIAAWTGVPGLSFLVAFGNLMAVIIARRIAGEIGPVFLKRIRWEFSLAVSLIVLVFAYGVRTLWDHADGPAVTLHVAAVQPNIPQDEKFDARSEQSFLAAENKIFAQFDALTQLAATAQPQLLLWPEAATPQGLFADETNFRFVQKEAQRGDFALLLGTLDSDLKRNEDFNVAVLLSNHGGDMQIYRKIHLVPFGEYLPLRPFFGLFAGQLVPADFTPGREFTMLQLPSPKIKMAALICFEDTVGDLTRRFVKNGAQLLVNITNDGWFLQSAGAEQHLANAVFRAVENRRTLIRCANTGITCAVDPWGRVDRWLTPFTPGFAARELKIATNPELTFYARHGDVFALACALATCGALLVRGKFR